MRLGRSILLAFSSGFLTTPFASGATAQQRLIYIDGKPIHAEATSLKLVGEDGTSRTLSADELASLPQKEVSVAGRDSSRTPSEECRCAN